MIKKIGIILFLLLSAQYGGRPQGAAPTGLAFAEGPPCPPECVTDSLEIETYYPSPYGYYEELRGDKIIVGDTDNSHIDETHLPPSGTLTFEPKSYAQITTEGTLYEGTVYYDSFDHEFKYYDNNSSWQPLGGGGGGFTNMEVFDTAGLGTFEVLPGVTKVMVELWGGGGGGGSTVCPTPLETGTYGGSGGGGAYGRGIINVSPGIYSVLVGEGGIGRNGCGENGEDGGESSFRNLSGNLISAGGGKGGKSSTSTVTVGSSSEGGTSAAPENISGLHGHPEVGGGSPKGGAGGGVDYWWSLPVVEAQPPGGGGTGRIAYVSVTYPSYTQNATNGAHGRVIVWW